MRKLSLFIALISLLETAQAQKPGILQGQVFWVSGDQMPGPDKVRNPQQGIVREIHIYNAANLSDATQQDGFFTAIQTTFITKVMSESDGSFKVKLPPGKYSVFVKENKGLFANLYDSNGCINCVSVTSRKSSWITLTVDYLAAY